VEAQGLAEEAAIAGDRQGLIVAIGKQANIVGAAFKSTASDVCGRAVVSPGLKLAAFEPAHGGQVQIRADPRVL